MHPDVAALAALRHGVFTRWQALDCGYDRREIDREVRAGRWLALRRGAYIDAALAESRRAVPRAWHLTEVAAGLASIRVPAVASHGSAAVAWDLPLVRSVPEVPALTMERKHRRHAPGLELHTAVTPASHRAVAQALPVTSVARTVSDLARSLPLAHAVVVADAALHRGVCTASDLAAVVADCWVWPGIARTKRVLEIVDRRSESPGESLSRVAMRAAGLPSPELQGELLLGGRRVRVDFIWPRRRVVGEFDGRVKYGRTEDLWKEKLREDLIRSHGYRVVRWTWADVHPDPGRMVERLSRALADTHVVDF